MKKWLFTIGLLLSAQFLIAQAIPLMKPVPDCPFAHLDRNRILYPGDSLTMERFFQKMDSVVFFGKGNVNIIHIGGSHVQAGTFTQQFRDNLLSIAPDLVGGQSFVFPFTIGKTNNPVYYQVSYTGVWDYSRNAWVRETDKRMGLAGAAVTTSDPKASVTLISKPRNCTAQTPEFKFNKVSILGFSDNENTMPVIDFRGKILQGTFNEEQSAYIFQLPDFTDTLNIQFESIQDEFTLTGILLENGLPGISVHGIGVNGASLPSYLRCDDFERDLALVKPDLVVFGIGINDAAGQDFSKETFKTNYKELISIIRNVNPDCALLFVTNNDSYKSIRIRRRTYRYEVNPNGALVEEAFMELGKELNAAVWDQFDIMGGLRSMQDWEKAGLAQADKIHFTNQGYKLIGDLLYNALIDRYIEHVQLNAKRP